jgi:hypothetical protein
MRNLLNGLWPATIAGAAERGFRGSTLPMTDVWVPSGASDAVWPDRRAVTW